MLAGLQYPSDCEAGVMLGRKAAEASNGESQTRWLRPGLIVTPTSGSPKTGLIKILCKQRAGTRFRQRRSSTRSSPVSMGSSLTGHCARSNLTPVSHCFSRCRSVLSCDLFIRDESREKESRQRVCQYAREDQSNTLHHFARRWKKSRFEVCANAFHRMIIRCITFCVSTHSKLITEQ